MRIVEVASDDDAAMKGWIEAYQATETNGDSELRGMLHLEELVELLTEQSPRRSYRVFSGVEADRVVATGWFTQNLLDNTDKVFAIPRVVPGEEGRGYGTAMLGHLEAQARAVGASYVNSSTRWPYDGGDDGSAARQVAFATRHGYKLGLVGIERRLRLPVADSVLDELAAQAAARHEGYRLVSWVGRIPDDLVGQWAEIVASLPTEAPVGDIVREPETPSVEAVREEEAQHGPMGLTSYKTVAMTPSGEMAAFTELTRTEFDPGLAFQWGTLVRRAHRGHRLGLAVKVANLRQMQALYPEGRTLITDNAEVNEHMIAINEALGFFCFERQGDLQKQL